MEIADRDAISGKPEIILLELVIRIIFLNRDDEFIDAGLCPDLIDLFTRPLDGHLDLQLPAWRKQAHGLTRPSEPHDGHLSGFPRLETYPVLQGRSLCLRLVGHEPDADGKKQRDRLGSPICQEEILKPHDYRTLEPVPS